LEILMDGVELVSFYTNQQVHVNIIQAHFSVERQPKKTSEP
jgi:hypothetical protein